MTCWRSGMTCVIESADRAGRGSAAALCQILTLPRTDPPFDMENFFTVTSFTAVLNGPMISVCCTVHPSWGYTSTFYMVSFYVIWK